MRPRPAWPPSHTAASIARRTFSKRSVAAWHSSITTTTVGSIFSCSAAHGSKAHPRAPPIGCIKNNRDGTFTDVTAKAGLAREGWASAVTVGDYNNDGHEDLFITYWGQNVLYHNNGDGTFTDVTKRGRPAATGKRWGSGCTWVDYNRDGHLDLFVANYLDFDLATLPKPGENPNCNWKGVPVNCGPRGLANRPSFPVSQ